MINEKELKEEKEYLETVYGEIEKQKEFSESCLNQYKKAFKEQMEYAVDSFYDMDDNERGVSTSILQNQETEIIKYETCLNRLNLLEKSAYFGRVDFNKEPYYIGVSSLIGDDMEKPFISDWRAPISSLYYDYELGDAEYLSLDGIVNGEITKKRQYKVDHNNLIYSFDSSLTIGDDILKETLSCSATDKMKNIVSTIQKEQNKIIRAPIGRNILIQGEAGSGKTSIALHRAAFLMYKRAGKLSASDIMIISPNRLFSEYISNVLPELGEKNILQITFNDLASKELPKMNFLSRAESISRALTNADFANQIRYKNSIKFLEELNKFLDKFSLSNFDAKDVQLGKNKISKETIKELYYNKYKSKNVAVKLGWIADYICDEFKLEQTIYSRILKVVYNMFTTKTILEIYNEFLAEQKLSLDNIYFEDVPALLYVKDYILGLENKQDVKYLLIDEMQDYGALHFDIFGKWFDCNKLIVGDINQNILDVYTQDYLVDLSKNIGNCDLVKLTKSYRSTFEISKFCQQIKNLDYDVVNRHGKDVEICECNSQADEIEKIAEIFNKNQHKKMALICKNDEEARFYFNVLQTKIKHCDDCCECGECHCELELVNGQESESDKIVISSANAKGIEFDIVIIPNAGDDNYSTPIEKNLLYISATRALHELYLTKV